MVKISSKNIIIYPRYIDNPSQTSDENDSAILTDQNSSTNSQTLTENTTTTSFTNQSLSSSSSTSHNSSSVHFNDHYNDYSPLTQGFDIALIILPTKRLVSYVKQNCTLLSLQETENVLYLLKVFGFSTQFENELMMSRKQKLLKEHCRRTWCFYLRRALQMHPLASPDLCPSHLF